MTNTKTKMEKRADMIGLVFGLVVLWLSVGVVSLNMLAFAPTVFWIVTGLFLVGAETRFRVLRPGTSRPISGWVDAAILVLLFGWILGAVVASLTGWGTGGPA